MDARAGLDEPEVVEAARYLVRRTAADGRVGLILAVRDVDVHGRGIDLLHGAGAPPRHLAVDDNRVGKERATDAGPEARRRTADRGDAQLAAVFFELFAAGLAVALGLAVAFAVVALVVAVFVVAVFVAVLARVGFVGAALAAPGVSAVALAASVRVERVSAARASPAIW